MLKLEDIKIGAEIAGLIPNELAKVVAVNPIGNNAVTVYYKTHSGEVKEQLLFRDSEPISRWHSPGWHGLLIPPVKTSNWLSKRCVFKWGSCLIR